jgi:hypothetical protein
MPSALTFARMLLMHFSLLHPFLFSIINHCY